MKNTLKITSAMKMVSSAKLFKAQQAIAGNIPYEHSLQKILTDLLKDRNAAKAFASHVAAGGRQHRVTLVLFSSDSSLCGAFNMNVIRKFHETLIDLYDHGYTDKEIDIYTVGQKISDAVKRQGLQTKGEWTENRERTEYQKAEELYAVLNDDFNSGRTEKILLVYNHFKSTAAQPSVAEVYLPLQAQEYRAEDFQDEFILEADAESLVEALIPKVLLLKLYAVILDANTAEHAARTVAMQVASDNAEALLQELTLSYNKTRQQAITSEILDIVGGTMQ